MVGDERRYFLGRKPVFSRLYKFSCVERLGLQVVSMNKIIFFLFTLATAPLLAATPITCTALSGLGYNLVYFGWTSSASVDTFAMAGSNDGKTWKNIPATWPTCGNGTPCQVNSPSAVCYNNNVYLLMAEADDANLNSTKQDIGVLNTDFSVTTLLTFDWASLGSVQTIFAGRWDKVPGSTNCFVTPVTFQPSYHIFPTYAACASLTPTSVSITSGPTLLTTTGSQGYDPQLFEQGGTCFLTQTQTDSTQSHRVTSLSAGSCLNGPFTFLTESDTPGSPLAQIYFYSTQVEGPNYLQTDQSGAWYFWAENVGTGSSVRQEFYSTCTPVTVGSCVMAPAAPWIEDQRYEAGTILRVTTTPLPGTTLQGGTLQGGTAQ